MPDLITWSTDEEIAKAIRDCGLKRVLIAGPQGVGKTTFGFDYGAWVKLQAWKVQGHSEASPGEILGMYVPGDKKFEWMDGPMASAYAGGLLIIDEIVEFSGPCKTLMYGALDGGKGGKISYVGREFVQSDKYMVIATMNGWPLDGGLPGPLLDRFEAVFIKLKPGKKQIATLEPDLQAMCERSYANPADPMEGPPISFRVLQSFQKLRKGMPLPQAALAACNGSQELAHAFLEVLALMSNDDDLDEEEE